jgi:hypothetical protein
MSNQITLPKTLIIDRNKFLDWYLDEDTLQEINIALLQYNKYTLDINDLLNKVLYIPEYVLVGGQEYTLDENDDVDSANVNFIFN